MFFYRDSSLSAFRFIILLLLFIFPIQGTRLSVNYKGFFDQKKIQRTISLHEKGYLVESMLPKSKHKKYNKYEKVTIDSFLKNDLNWNNWKIVLEENFPIGQNKNQRKQGTSYSMLPPSATKTKMELFHENDTNDSGVIGYLINIFEDENLNKNNASKDAISNLLQVPSPIKKHLKVAFLDDAINNKALTKEMITTAYEHINKKKDATLAHEKLITIVMSSDEYAIWGFHYVPSMKQGYYYVVATNNKSAKLREESGTLSENITFKDYALECESSGTLIKKEQVYAAMKATGINTRHTFYIDVLSEIDNNDHNSSTSKIYTYIKEQYGDETAEEFWTLTAEFYQDDKKFQDLFTHHKNPLNNPRNFFNTRSVSSTLQTFSVWEKTRTAVREKENDDDDDDDTYDYNDTENLKKYIPYNEIKLYDSQDQDLLGFIFNQSDKLYLYQEDNNNKKTYPKGTNLEEVLSCLLILVLAQEKKYEKTSKLLPVFRYHGANELTRLDIPAYYNELIEAKIIDGTSAYGNLLKQALKRLNEKIKNKNNNKLVDKTQENDDPSLNKSGNNNDKTMTQPYFKQSENYTISPKHTPFTTNGNNNNNSTSNHNTKTPTNRDPIDKLVNSNNNLKTWSWVYKPFTIMLVAFVSVLSYFYYFRKKK